MNEVITRWLQSCVMLFIAIWIGLSVIAIVAVILQILGAFESVVVLRVSQLAKESEVLKLLGIGLGGGILLWQAVIANRRAKAMEKSARAHANAVGAQARANQNTEQGQRQERLKNAVEHLGNESETVRLGGGIRTLPSGRGHRVATADSAEHPLFPYPEDDEGTFIPERTPVATFGGNTEPAGLCCLSMNIPFSQACASICTRAG